MLFDPPLSRWEKRIGWAWMITGGTAAVALWLGIFGWWGLLIVTIPVLLYALIAPGLFLYMSAILLPLLLTRRGLRPAGWAAAAMLVAALAIAPAWQSARDTQAGLAGAVAGDRGDRITLPRGGTVALLGLVENCDLACIEAFTDHGVAAVLIGDGRTTDPARPVTLPRMQLVPAGGQPCPPVGKTARQIPWLYPETEQKLAGSGRCLLVDTAPLASADVVQRYSYGGEDHAGATVGITRMEAWVRRDGRLAPVLRRTHAVMQQVNYPGIYLAPIIADNGRGPADWWRTQQERGDDLSDDLSRWWR
ncbi:MAG: hypothetical protein KGQ52_09920 [Alphaproteobacteria bacterium]|nr:hypothetical protein [Alphaproteobacteria bacterium]